MSNNAHISWFLSIVIRSVSTVGLGLTAGCNPASLALEAVPADALSKPKLRIIAVGDIHGDRSSAQQALKTGSNGPHHG